MKMRINGHLILYVLTIVILGLFITYMIFVLTMSIRDNKNEGREVDSRWDLDNSSTNVNIQSSEKSAGELEDEAEIGDGHFEVSTIDKALVRLEQAIEEQDAHALADLLSTDLQVFSAEDLMLAFSTFSRLRLSRVGQPRLIADRLVEQDMMAVDETGLVQVYKVILRQELGQWKLLGTLDQQTISDD